MCRGFPYLPPTQVVYVPFINLNFAELSFNNPNRGTFLSSGIGAAMNMVLGPGLNRVGPGNLSRNNSHVTFFGRNFTERTPGSLSLSNYTLKRDLLGRSLSKRVQITPCNGQKTKENAHTLTWILELAPI